MRPQLVPAIALLALPACFLFEKRAPTNVLFVVVDSLRYDAISRSIGAAETPNLLGLGQDGIAYSWCFAHSPATMPAHAALLSSRHPHSSGVRNDGALVDARVTLLAEHLSAQGWQTFADVSTAALEPRGEGQGIDRGFQVFHSHDGERATAAETNARVLPFLEHASRETPWFAYVQYTDPSAPDIARGEGATHAEVLLDGAPLGTAHAREDGGWREELELAPGLHHLELRAGATFNVRRLDITTDSGRVTPVFEAGRLFTPLESMVVNFQNERDRPVMFRFDARIRGVQALAQSRARYKHEVETVDRAIGEVVSALKARGLYDDTVIVVTGSHGESLGEHGITGHDVSLYDEMLRVPLIFKPIANDERRVDLARRQYSLVRHVDVAATVLDLVGERPMSGAEGRSLTQDGDRELWAEAQPPEAPGTMCLRRDDRYTLIYVAQDDRFEMYDAKSDTLELENVFTLQGHFRSKWQMELRALAQGSPQAANARMGFSVRPPTAAQNQPARR